MNDVTQMMQRLFKASFVYLVAIFTTSIIVVFLFYIHGLHMAMPSLYQGDSLAVQMYVKNITDTGWYLKNPFLGAPGVASFLDYPISDSGSFLIIKCLSLFTHQYAIVLNLFYYLTYILATVFALFVFKRLGLNRAFALSASLLFTFLPYHFFRGEGHLFLSAYYVIPIYVYFMFVVFQKSHHTTETRLGCSIRYGFYALACLFAASSGVYYAFFASFLLLVIGCVTSFDQKSWKPFAKSMLFLSFISVTILINISPYFINRIEYGKNPITAQRQPSDSELFSLRMTQLVFPNHNNQVAFLHRFGEYYDRSTLIALNESFGSTLGIIGGAGFLSLILIMFVRRWLISNDRLYFLSVLNLNAFLLGTMSGFGAIFAYTLSPMIRGYNRISVFIAFFSLCGFFYGLQLLIERRWTHQVKHLSLLLAVVLTILGLYTQIPEKQYRLTEQPLSSYHEIRFHFNSDTAFVREIESQLPAGSMIFELPIMMFPENGPVNALGDYQLARGYLHSHTLRWSYGAMGGRPTIGWQTKVSQASLPKMVNILVYAGFNGIVLARQGFKDHGKNIQKKLTVLLDQKPLISQDGEFVFYDLQPYRQKLKHSLSGQVWDARFSAMTNELAALHQ